YLFFFSSRRRHTRSKRDWSSDVCSSDLWYCSLSAPSRQPAFSIHNCRQCNAVRFCNPFLHWPLSPHSFHPVRCTTLPHNLGTEQIGRASCRERVERSTVAVL